ncbi:MAG: hypothetical protein JWN50_541 [Parcubacteria group bacterium]|nr:hypothetical protein [Parcubacteria group bacterium]
MSEIGNQGQSLNEIYGKKLGDCSYGELFTLGLATIRFPRLPENAPEIVKRAHGFFYPGMHEPYYPHIASLSREALIEILKMAEGRALLPLDRSERIDTLIRPSSGLFNPDKTCVMFISGHDSRRAKQDPKYYPRFVKVMSGDEFEEIVETDSLAFLKALGCAPGSIPYWETPHQNAVIPPADT